MTLTFDPSRPETAVVVGAGVAGLAATIGLARAGLPVTLVGGRGPERPGRTVALFDGAVALLQRYGVWERLAAVAAPLAAMRIVDATGSLFRPPPVVFRAEELGLPRFGYNVPNDILEAALFETVATLPGVELVADAAVDAAFSPAVAVVKTRGGTEVHGALVVAADGRRSRIRKAARIGVHETLHPQHALTALLAHELPHADISTEFHTRQGPFTLVPLPDGPDGRARSSLVWVMSPSEAERRSGLAPETLVAEMERQCGRLLGGMSLTGPVGRFPIFTSVATRLVGPRLVLIGEAAHALPPIGAQGLNLSLRDVATLVTHLGRAKAIGDPAVLSAYAHARAGDVALRTAGVGLLNGSLLSHTGGADFLRGAGLAALSRSGPLRRFAMRHGLAPDAAIPQRP